MSSPTTGISVTREGKHVRIMTTVGNRVAWVTVTREYANQLAARLMVAALDYEHVCGEACRRLN